MRIKPFEHRSIPSSRPIQIASNTTPLLNATRTAEPASMRVVHAGVVCPANATSAMNTIAITNEAIQPIPAFMNLLLG